MTMTAFVQPLLLNLMVPKDAVEDFRPGYRTLGFWPYVYYVTQLTFLFTLIYFLLLSFSFHLFLDFIISFVSSWALTLLLCLIFEGFHKKGHE